MIIRKKLICGILGFITPMIFIIVVISYISFSNSSNKNYLNKLALISSAIGKSVDEKMDNYFNSLELASKMFSGYSSNSSTEVLDYRLLILDNLRNQTGVNESYYGLEDGTAYAIMAKGIIPNFNAKKLKREWYTRIFNGEDRVVTTPYISSIGDTVMALGVPIKNGGNIEATLCINLPLAEITNFTKDILDFENIYLTRSDGFLMASKNEDNIGKSLWDIVPSLEEINNLSETSMFNFSIDDVDYEGYISIIESLGWKVWTFENKEIINTASKNNLVLNIIITCIAILLSVIMIILLSRSISKPLSLVTENLEEISKGGGDLTKEIIINSKDETRNLAENFNKFTQNLKIIVTNIKQTSINSNNIGIKLNNSSTQAASASLDITKNVETIGSQIKFLDNNVNETTSGIYEISSNISQFKRQIEDQVSAVEESSASIEEMIASLDNVSKITNKKLESTKRLVNATRDGEKLLSETNTSFKEGISDKISNIKDMIDVISNISERTNLLAMNAAIEAAHAGESGKGFSVVADEIRKMAEEAANSSKSISEIIVIIINAINKTDVNIDNTSKAFTTIFKEVGEIDIALNEIASNTIELSSGGHEILKAVSLLNDTTSNISHGVKEIEIGAEDVTEAMVQVQNISNEVFSGVGEITTGIQEVSLAFQEVSDLADNLGKESKNLSKEVDLFII